MSANVGTVDRIVRIIVGLTLIAWALGYIPGMNASIWGWIGLIPLATALVGWCPVYSRIGVNTCCARKA